MVLFDRDSLIRGQAYLECAYRGSVDEGYEFDIPASDIISMAAWSIGGWMDKDTFKETVEGFFDESTFNKIKYVKELFNIKGEGGLWNLGPAIDDVRFLHPLLIDFYPGVNARADGALKRSTQGAEWGNVTP